MWKCTKQNTVPPGGFFIWIWICIYIYIVYNICGQIIATSRDLTPQGSSAQSRLVKYYSICPDFMAFAVGWCIFPRPLWTTPRRGYPSAWRILGTPRFFLERHHLCLLVPLRMIEQQQQQQQQQQPTSWISWQGKKSPHPVWEKTIFQFPI